MEAIFRRFYLSALERLGKKELQKIADPIADQAGDAGGGPTTILEMAELVLRHNLRNTDELNRFVAGGFKNGFHQQAFCRLLKKSASVNRRLLSEVEVGSVNDRAHVLHSESLRNDQYQLLMAFRTELEFRKDQDGTTQIVKREFLIPVAVMLSASRLIVRIMSMQGVQWSRIIGEEVVRSIGGVRNNVILEQVVTYLENHVGIEDREPFDFSTKATAIIESENICTHAGERQHYDDDGELQGYSASGTPGALHRNRECLREALPEYFEDLVDAPCLKYCDCRAARDFHGIPADSGFLLRPFIGLVIIRARPEGGDLNEFFRYLTT